MTRLEYLVKLIRAEHPWGTRPVTAERADAIRRAAVDYHTNDYRAGDAAHALNVLLSAFGQPPA